MRISISAFSVTFIFDLSPRILDNLRFEYSMANDSSGQSTLLSIQLCIDFFKSLKLHIWGVWTKLNLDLSNVLSSSLIES